VISTLPWIRNLDFSSVTKRDKDNALSWRKITKVVVKPAGAGGAAGASAE
jgi:hypothetical protein